MSHRLKVFVVSRGIPTEENPMSGIFEWDQARALKAAGVEVTFIVLDLRSLRRKRSLSTRTYMRDGINIIYGSMPLGALPAPVVYTFGRLKLKRLIGKAVRLYGRPDVIHGHFTEIGAITASVARKEGIPCVITEHSSALNRNVLSSSTIYFGQRGYSDANAVIAVSDGLSRRIAEHFGVSSTVIPNVVDVAALRFPQKTAKRSRAKLFVAIGNLLPLKGHDLLVASFANPGIDKDSRLIIIGEGPERENLQRQISSLGMQDRIILAGRKNRNEISEFLAQADCFVLASRSETFGVVYIEAMFAGLPVIATRCGGPEDFVSAETGLLIDTENVDQLTEALKYMSENIGNYSSEEIHKYAIDKFSPEVIARQLIQVYKSITE